MSNELTERERDLHDYMVAQPVDTDVLISDIHTSLYTDNVAPVQQQQRIGALASKINSKVEFFRIVPGELKRTYRRIAWPRT